ncbi:hypothetical protein UT300012_24320 [Paraclostridium bifermentans]
MEEQTRQVEIVKGDLLKSNSEMLVHQVNMQGVMGAGLAKQIRKRYPEVYRDYKNRYKEFNLGDNLYCSTSDGHIIVNMFSQKDYGRSGLFTDYDAMEIALFKIAEIAMKHDVSVGIPYGIGCGLGGGNWEEVYARINKAFKNCNLAKIKIYKL